MSKTIIQKKIQKLAAQANFSLRKDVARLLKKAYQAETKKLAKKALGWIKENARLAQKENLALCQDTGLPLVFIEAGRDVKVTHSLIDTIVKAVESGYQKNYLRASIVGPLIRKNPSFKGVIYHLDFSNKFQGLKLTIFPKGFGSENKSSLKMFNPTAAVDEIEEFIVEAVKKAGPEACPPFVVGVGIGGTSDTALLLAKKVLLDGIDQPNPNKLLDNLEKRLLKKINALKIGPMGLGGKITALAVKIKTAPTHIAGLPVGVNISCHALRSASIKLI